MKAMKKFLLIISILKFAFILLGFSFLIFAPLFTWKINETQTFICNGYIALFGGNFGNGENSLAPVALIAFLLLTIALIWNIFFFIFNNILKKEESKVFKLISYLICIFEITAGVMIYYSLFNFVAVNDYGSTIPQYFHDTYFFTLSGSFVLIGGLLNTFEILVL